MKQTKNDQQDKMVRLAGVTCLIGLGGFLGWAGLVPLEEGIAASGRIVVENDRQVVQHFEGGIVETIAVREGDIVEAGQVVVTLRETGSLSDRDQLTTKIAALLAKEARLEALLNDESEPDFGALDTLNLKPSSRAALIAEESNLFGAGEQSFAADLRVLSERAEAARRTAQLRARQIESTEKARRVVEEDLQRSLELLSNQMIRRDQVTRLERELASLDADVARLKAQRDESAASAEDAERQSEQSRAELRQQTSAELRDARAERLAVQERLNAAQDVLDRSIIVAPVDGEVLNLAVTTPGSVVSSAETIMEIVPREQQLVASVRVRPTDRASVYEGQIVRTQISAYRSWQTPRLDGEVVGVSADLKTDPATGNEYYEARILLAAREDGSGQILKVTPGMPVDAFIYSGHSRTTLDYVFAPLRESVFKGLRTG